MSSQCQLVSTSINATSIKLVVSSKCQKVTFSSDSSRKKGVLAVSGSDLGLELTTRLSEAEQLLGLFQLNLLFALYQSSSSKSPSLSEVTAQISDLLASIFLPFLTCTAALVAVRRHWLLHQGAEQADARTLRRRVAALRARLCMRRDDPAGPVAGGGACGGWGQFCPLGWPRTVDVRTREAVEAPAV